MISQLLRNRKGQGMVEYALLVAGVALVAIVGVSMMGHKTADLIGTVASILPGAHADDNGPVVSAHLIETTNATGSVGIDAAAIGTGPARQSLNDRIAGGTTTGEEFVTETGG